MASKTGNTEKIASAIYEEVSLANEAVLNKLDDVNPDSLNGYDQIFIGSPIHAGTIAREVQDFLIKLPPLPNMRMAGFITHAATAYPKQALEKMTQPFADICKGKKIKYLGCFSCQGYLADFMHEAVQKMQNASDAEWQEKVKRMTGHPNEEDEADAKAFTRAAIEH